MSTWWTRLTVLTIFMGPASTQDSEYRVVCYLRASSFENGFSFDNIEEVPCTHLIYSHAYLDPDVDAVNINETDRVNIESLVAFREKTNKQFKAMIQIGNDYNKNKFAEVTSSPEKREKFIKSIDALRSSFDLDGVDLHWKYPLRENNVSNQKNNYLSLAQELRVQFKKYLPGQKLVLSMIVPNQRRLIIPGFNLLVLNSVIDFVSLPAYDFPSMHHHSSLSATSNPSDREKNAEFMTKIYLRVGAVAQRLNLGIPLFGRLMKKNSMDAPRAVQYNTLCHMIGDGGWIKSGDVRTGPLAETDSQILSYDNETSILAKMELMKELRLGGVMFWSMNMDDWNSTCPQSLEGGANLNRWPLIRTARNYIEKNVGPLQRDRDPLRNSFTSVSTSTAKTNDRKTEEAASHSYGNEESAVAAPILPTIEETPSFVFPPATIEQENENRPANDRFPFTHSILPPFLVVEAGKDIIIEDVQIQHNENYYNRSRRR